MGCGRRRGWVGQGPITYGPATATAGGVTVTATPGVLGQLAEGRPWHTGALPRSRYPLPAVHGPGAFPDCGSRYARPSASRLVHREGTLHLTVIWQVQDGAGADSGQWTETRATTQGAAIGGTQVVAS